MRESTANSTTLERPSADLFGAFKRGLRAFLLRVFPDAVFLVLRHVVAQKRIPSLTRPTAFTEKVLCKMLYDRNELMPVVADKVAVRDYVEARVGPGVLSRLYAVYDSEDDIRLDELPDRFVLKANHGSGLNHFVDGPGDKDPEIIRSIAREWLNTNYGDHWGEWAYQPIKPRVLAEEYLDLEYDHTVDYKFFCFDGEPRFLKVVYGQRSGGEGRFYDVDWNTFDVYERKGAFPEDLIPRPENLAEMTEICRKLTQGFDFLRVDLYNIDGRIVFGELTNYHNASRHRFHPREYDFKFGAYWRRESMTYLPKHAVGGS